MPTRTGRAASRFSTSFTRDRLVVEVTDDGAGFEPPDRPGDVLDGQELNEGGLGIAIIEALADELEIREREQGGSSLRFVKLF